MKKILLSFLSLAIAVFSATTVKAADTYELPSTGTEYSSYAIPIALATSNTASTGTYTSVTQQIYLASELKAAGASSGSYSISGLTFYYKGKDNGAISSDVTRHLKIYITTTSADSFAIQTLVNPQTSLNDYRYIFKNPGGSPVCDKEITIEAVPAGTTKELKISFSPDFAWDGTSNILLTVFDVTNTAIDPGLRFVIKSTADARFVSEYWTSSGTPNAINLVGSLEGEKGGYYPLSNAAKAKQQSGHKYVPKIKFSIEPITPPSTPTGLAASEASTSSITLSWNAASSATAYDLQYKDGESWEDLASDLDETSYTWTGLTANTSYEMRVRATNSVGNSDWSDPVTVSTEAIHEHNSISFEKWSSTNSLPTSGNYYLGNNVTLDPSDPQTITLTGNLNLCLNGKTANLYGAKIVVPSGKTLAIYDNVGEGKLTGFVLSEAGMENYSSALIVVKSGGTLVLKEGSVENTYEPDEDGNSYAIYSNGTINLSGDVTINSYTADIYLYSSNVITITGTLSNTEKHTVCKSGGTFTSGWSTYMSSEDPSDYFESADDAKAVYFNGSEAALRTVLHLSENSTNASIGTNYNQTVDVSLTRSLTSAQYNTFCLPFALTDAQLRSVFGSSYDLEELTASSLTGETLNLEFIKRTALEAGKPYLLQPSVNVTNPVFEGVTITATSPGTSTTTYVDYKAVYSPTSLEGGNRNLLFLGAGNELFWPEADGNLNGFRAYFEIKCAAAQAAKRARISMGGKIATGNLSPALPQGEGVKILRDGKLYLMYKGQMYDVQGKRM